MLRGFHAKPSSTARTKAHIAPIRGLARSRAKSWSLFREGLDPRIQTSSRRMHLGVIATSLSRSMGVLGSVYRGAAMVVGTLFILHEDGPAGCRDERVRGGIPALAGNSGAPFSSRRCG